MKERTEYTPERVKAVRKATGLSQSLFALAIGATPQTLRNWEQGRIVPKGAAARVLDLVEQDSDILSAYVRRVDPDEPMYSM